MNQIGNNRQHAVDEKSNHFNTTEDQDKIKKKQEQQAYLQQLDTVRMKKSGSERKEGDTDEERKYMSIGQNGVNKQPVSAQQEVFSRAGA